MDQDLYEADEANTPRVRLASSSTSTSKVPSRAAQPYPADVDMDVLSLVSLLSINPQTNNKKPIFTKFIEPYTCRRAATRCCIRTTHEAMGQRRRRCQQQPPWNWRWTRKRFSHRYRYGYGRRGRCSSHRSSPTWWLSYGREQTGEEAHQCHWFRYRYHCHCHRRTCAQDSERVVGCCGSTWAIRCLRAEENM